MHQFHRWLAPLALALAGCAQTPLEVPGLRQAVDLEDQSRIKVQAVSGRRKQNPNYIPPPDLAPFWHAPNDTNGAVDDEPAFSEDGDCAFNLEIRVSDPEGRALTFSEPSGDWPDGCTADYNTAQVSGSPTTAGSGSVTVRACDPLPANNCTNQVFNWTVEAGGDVTAPSTPGTPTLVSQDATQVVIQWTASTDASGIDYYEVHRALNACDQAFALASGGTIDAPLTQFTHSNNQGIDRCYKIKAFDNAGNASAFSGTYLNTVFGGPGAADTIVDADGSEISAAWAAATAGDIIEIRTVTPGGTETTPEPITCTNKDGTNGNEIILRVRSGDNVIIDAPNFSLDVTGCDYWKIDGQDSDRSGLRFGDVTDWNTTTFTYNQDRGVNIDGAAHHFELRNLTIYGGASFTCNLIDRTTNIWRLSNVIVDLCGTNNTPGGLDTGDLIRTQGFNYIIEDSEFRHGGHNGLSVYGGWGVLRDVIASGDWTDKATGFPGARSMAFLMGNQENWQPDNVSTSSFGRILAERMDIRDNASAADRGDSAAFKLQGFGLIMRDSIIACDDGVMIKGPGYTDVGTATGEIMSRSHLYNNTVTGCEGIWFNTDGGFASAMSALNQQNLAFKNDIFSLVGTGITQPHAVYWDNDKAGATAQLNGHANAWKGSLWQFNNFSGPSANMQFKLLGPGAATVAITNCTTWPNQICNNTNGTPTFVNESARTRAGLILQAGSAVGINDGTHLTTTTDAGTADTTLTFADPYYFYAGADPATWNLAYFGEVGDDICVGAATATTAENAQATRIITINYATGAVTVTVGVDHVNGSKVWKRTQGSATCADAWDGRGIQTGAFLIEPAANMDVFDDVRRAA
jgi:hypothetical protein